MGIGRPQTMGRDRVRLSALEEQQATAAPIAEKKPEYDNDKLLTFLGSAKGELQGLRLIHFHLSLLRDRDTGHHILVRTVINELATKASYLQIFALDNGDIIVIYKGLKLASITEVCQKIEAVIIAKTPMVGANPYGEPSLYSIIELSIQFASVLRFIEDLSRSQKSGMVQIETKPPITLEEMGKLERSMGIFDLSPFLFNQAIVHLAQNAQYEQEYYELYISIKLLQERLCPDYDLTANKWLFNYFTANLDQSVLRALTQGRSFMRGQRIGININLATVISTGFVKFDEAMPREFRGNVVLEINKGDLLENIQLFDEVADFAREKNYRLAIDGLNPFWVLNLDIDYLGVDYAKIYWSSDMMEMDETKRAVFLERMKEQERTRYVLCRCETVRSLLFAKEVGIGLVQGRAVDNILRKGVSVRDAVSVASGMNASNL